jgi:GNAT superfamily N-acetyltransferase
MNPDDAPAIRDLMQRAFGSDEAPQAGARWSWLFLNPPAHAAPRYLVADAGARLAGQLAGITVQMQHRHGRVLGLCLLDMATDPDYRRQGVFTAVAKQLYDETAGMPIVFGFPNTIAAPIHYQRFGWVELRPFPFLIRPLGNVKRSLAAAAPSLAPLGRPLEALALPLRAFEHMLKVAGERGSASVLPLDRFSSWADTLWAQLAPRLGTCVVRDAAYLNWRFCASPYSYRRYALHRDGSPVAFAVTTFSHTRLGKLCHLLELMVPDGDRAGARLLLAHTFLDAAREGATGICTIATRRHPHYRTMLHAGFVRAPGRLKAQQAFGVRQNGPGVIPNDLFHIDDWYISGADQDTL